MKGSSRCWAERSCFRIEEHLALHLVRVLHFGGLFLELRLAEVDEGVDILLKNCICE